jgi:DNA uptake protein ComE-like DNA-binding protein
LYERALPFFPGQAKLLGKIERLRVKLGKAVVVVEREGKEGSGVEGRVKRERKGRVLVSGDEDGTEADIDEEEDVVGKSPVRGKGLLKKKAVKAGGLEEEFDDPTSPRVKQLLDIVNSRDLVLIKGLHGFGAKKAQDLVDCLALRGDEESGRIESLARLRTLPGMGGRTIERAYDGLVVV